MVVAVSGGVWWRGVRQCLLVPVRLSLQWCAVAEVVRWLAVDVHCAPWHDTNFNATRRGDGGGRVGGGWLNRCLSGRLVMGT